MNPAPSLKGCCPAVVLAVLVPAHLLFSQRPLNAHSRLNDSVYVSSSVKTISDRDLFAAMDLSVSTLKKITAAARKENYPSAYQAWAEYWKAKNRPAYVTQNYRMLIDTDMLMSYDSLRAYVRRHPEERDTILNRAAMLVEHKIPAWGDVVLEFGPKIDFNRNAGQSGKYGFHYWIWARPLNAAFVITGDQRYAKVLEDLFLQWYDQRNSIEGSIPDLDVVYYELGLGVRNRIFIEYYSLPIERRWQTDANILKTMLGAARWLYELELWEGYRSGNWQIHGSYMLTQIALTFPEFRESRNWLELGLRRLKEHLKQDFFEDGGHSERAPRNYTQATYVAYRNLYYLLTQHQVDNEFAAKIRKEMSRTIDWWITMLTPTGEVPAINDSHRGLFPIFLLQDAAAFYRKPEVYGVLNQLFGSQVPVQASTLPPFTSRNMSESGFAVMRTGWSRDALYANINYGRWNGSHTHNDMLDFELYAYGQAIAVDAGIGLTYDDPLYVPWYKSSKAHNMVLVNDLNIEREQTVGKEITWYSSGTLDLFAASHDGYAFKGVQHRRTIVFVKPSYWVFYDRVTGTNPDDTVRWYFHTPLRLSQTTGGFQSLSIPGFQLVSALPELKTIEGSGMAASTVDATPGRTERINWIAFEQPSVPGKPVEFMIVLAPFRKRAENVRLEVSAPGCLTISWTKEAVELRFGLNSSADSYSDAELVMIRTDEDGLRRYWVVNGTYLKEGNTTVWSSPSRASAEGAFARRK